MLSLVKGIITKLYKRGVTRHRNNRIQKYLDSGRVPWSEGYADYKSALIETALIEKEFTLAFVEGTLPNGYGVGVDERIVEYPWAINNLSSEKTRLLDAGSTFNFEYIVKLPKILNKDLTICTYYPEKNNYNQERISYVYSDLRLLPFKDGWFNEIVCLSTLEHIGMDNSIYGYDLKTNLTGKQQSFEYINAVKELIRVLSHKGTLLISVPYGKYEAHGFFQQFDAEMIDKIQTVLSKYGTLTNTFFKYTQNGWTFASQESCDNSKSYNPHTGVGKGVDLAAHCRSVSCIKFTKTNKI